MRVRKRDHQEERLVLIRIVLKPGLRALSDIARRIELCGNGRSNGLRADIVMRQLIVGPNQAVGIRFPLQKPFAVAALPSIPMTGDQLDMVKAIEWLRDVPVILVGRFGII